MTQLATRKVEDVLLGVMQHSDEAQKMIWYDVAEADRTRESLQAIGRERPKNLSKDEWLPDFGIALLGLAFGRSILCVGETMVWYFPIYTFMSRAQFPDKSPAVLQYWLPGNRQYEEKPAWHAAARDFVKACLKDDHDCIVIKVRFPDYLLFIHPKLKLRWGTMAFVFMRTWIRPVYLHVAAPF